jgi:hypothetical protein
VYVAPPAADVVSPNGDGVDEEQVFALKVVRPSSVDATVVAPDGKTQTLLAQTVQPGTRTVAWKPDAAAPEGRWLLRARATDDLGRASTAERPFAVNETLGQLAVAPATVRVRRGGGRLSVAFTLARPAKVRVTVETRSGVVVATVAERAFAAGRQQVVWNGRAAGRAVAGGQYVVRVRAQNEVGDVDLLAPFRARRR